MGEAKEKEPREQLSIGEAKEKIEYRCLHCDKQTTRAEGQFRIRG